MSDRTAIDAKEIQGIVKNLVIRANRFLPHDVKRALLRARRLETTKAGQIVMDVLIDNAILSEQTGLPICQDTGIDVVLIELGQSIEIHGDLYTAVNQGISQGTKKGYLRASVCDPLTRTNTGDNTPGVIHVELKAGKDLKITVMPKGCGSENMSDLFMLPPSAGIDGVIHSVVEKVGQAGPNPCPPGIIGIGIGGTMEMATLLAKKALLRPIGVPSERHDLAVIEQGILDGLNKLGIGPSGLGGGISALSVAIESFPCHIASLPVAVNIQCHAVRHASAIWKDGDWHIEDLDQEGIYFQDVHEKLSDISDSFKVIDLPLSQDVAKGLRAGDWVLLNGPVFTARDQTHRRLVELIDSGKSLPVELRGQLIYYVGPTPAPPGSPVGSAGPTTSYRMDAYTPRLLEHGVLATMGKGMRSPMVIEAMKRFGAVYLSTIGGAGAYLSRRIQECELVAFEDLGPEALYRMTLRHFPAIVINDSLGNDYYKSLRI